AGAYQYLRPGYAGVQLVYIGGDLLQLGEEGFQFSDGFGVSHKFIRRKDLEVSARAFERPVVSG
ncbi:MAG: hypothetical protein ACI819_002882, partial [Neolewinella sp.]